MVNKNPPIENLQIHLFKNSKEPFINLLHEYRVEHRRLEIRSNAIHAQGILVEIALNSAPWVALASVICTYLKNLRLRKVIITTKDNQTIHCEGLSQKQVEAIIQKAKNIAVIDTNPPST